MSGGGDAAVCRAPRSSSRGLLPLQGRGPPDEGSLRVVGTGSPGDSILRHMLGIGFA